jgi:outer membrane protein assembly factor BamB
VYTFDRNGGTVSCFDAKTGKAEYTKERISNAKAFWASPWAYEGKIFAIDESGVTHVLKAGPTFEPIRTNALDRDVYWSTPAVAGGNLFIRSVDALVCVK